MGGAAVAEEALGLGIGVLAERLDPGRGRRRRGGRGQSLRDRTGDGRRGRRRRSAQFRGRPRRSGGGRPRRPHSCAGRCTGPTAAAIRLAPRAEPLHRGDRRFDHAAEARPSSRHGRRRSRPASRSASRTGAQSAVRMPSARPGRSVTMRVGLRARVVGPGRGQRRAPSAEWTWWTVTSAAPGRHRLDRAAAILGDRVAVVVRARGRH